MPREGGVGFRIAGPAFISLGLMDAFFAFWGTALGLLASMNSLGGVCIVWISGMLSDKEGIGFGFLAMVFSYAAGLLRFLLRYGALFNAEIGVRLNRDAPRR